MKTAILILLLAVLLGGCGNRDVNPVSNATAVGTIQHPTPTPGVPARSPKPLATPHAP